MNKILLPFLLSFCSAFLLANNDFTIEKYHVDIQVSEAGIIQVVETIDVNYHKKMRGIYRDINTHGKFLSHTQRLTLSDIHVDNYKYKVEKKSKQFRIRIGDANKYIQGRHTYTIHYTAANGILNFENHEEFYWNVISPEWEQKILRASFEIKLPKAIVLSEDDMRILAGFDKETTSWGKIKQEGDKLIGSSLVELGKGKGMSTSFKVPKGYFFASAFTETEKKNNYESTKRRKDHSYPLPLAAIAILLWAYLTKGRNKDEYIPEDVYYPPSNMTPAVVGTFYDNTVNNRDVISLIPYWGQEGKIKLSALDSSKDSEILLEKIEDLEPGRPEHEQYFFNALFKDRNSVFISDLKHKFYSEYAKVKSLIKEEALDPPYYDQEAIKKFHSWPILVFSLFALVAGMLSMLLFHLFITGASFIALAIVGFVVYFLPRKKSNEGVQLKHSLQSLKSSIENFNEMNLNRVIEKDQNYFESLFPYAVAFGIDDSFVEKFDSLGAKVPDYYGYESGRQASYKDFRKDLSIEKIGKTMSIPPVADNKSSSFNRSSGGGSVGGGFGGGGGGGW